MSSTCPLFRFLLTGTVLNGSSSVVSLLIFSLVPSAMLFSHVCVAISCNRTISFPDLLPTQKWATNTSPQVQSFALLWPVGRRGRENVSFFYFKIKIGIRVENDQYPSLTSLRASSLGFLGGPFTQEGGCGVAGGGGGGGGGGVENPI